MSVQMDPTLSLKNMTNLEVIIPIFPKSSCKPNYSLLKKQVSLCTPVFCGCGTGLEYTEDSENLKNKLKIHSA